LLVITVAACLPAGGPNASRSARPTTGETDLLPAATGICDALAALPDTTAAERAFTNVAHDALHALAAEPALDRSLAAAVLEAMERVETDFATPADAARLSDDLTRLHDAAASGLRGLGKNVTSCPG
jgi:hypothetical protein